MSVGWDEVFPEPAPVPGRFVTRRRAVVAALVTAIAMAVGGVAWLLTYKPLEPGSAFAGPEQGTLAWSRADTGIGDVVYYVSIGKPGTFSVGYDVENGGRLPVTIQGLGSSAGFTLKSMNRYPTFEDPTQHVPGQLVPFEPVSIEPGESRFLVLQITIDSNSVCGEEGGAGVPSDPSLRYRTLGIVPGEATVGLPFTVVKVCGDTLPPDYHAQVGR